MSPSDRERVKELLSWAACLPPEQRTAFISAAAARNREVASEALDLLGTLEDERFMSAPTGAGLTATLRVPAALREGPGTHVGRYKLLQLIGEGGFGSVFMAEQSEPVFRRVALKIIKAGMDTRQVIARFEAERQALALMDHPNIARVLDAGATDSGRPYFVMELVRGEPITQFCDGARLSVRQRLRLFRDVCHAVQHAHQKGIIHRDIKPSNVLVTIADSEPLPKVIDFGIAKATAGRLTEKTLYTELHQLIGTPQYMSPEQAEGSGVDIDTRSDVYSLGVLLYELLAGTTPIDGGRLRSLPFSEIQRLIREEEPPRPSLRLATLAASSGRFRQGPPAPPDAAGDSSDSSALEIARRRRSEPLLLTRALRGDLDWIVMKCLEKDRRRRYGTASSLAEEIGRFLAHQPVSAIPPSRGYKLRKFARRNRGLVLAGSAIAATLLAATGVSIRFAWREAAARERETQQRSRAERALVEEEKQRKLADQRADETKQVADFQARMLAEIDVDAMGRGLKEHFRDQVRSSLERQYVGDWPDPRKYTPDEIDAQLKAFDETAAPAQAADVARRIMDEYVLRRAGEALEEQFADQPLVQARLRDAIGTTYRALGLFDAAEPHLRAALELRQRELGATDADVATSLNSLASLLRDKADYAAAEPLYREVLAMQRERFGGEHTVIAASLNNLALMLNDRADYAAAESLLREALAMQRKLLGDEHEEVVTTLSNLASLLYGKGDYAAAEPLLREAVAMRRKLLGDENLQVATSLNKLAMVLRAKGDYAAAEPLYREALGLFRKLHGDEHPHVAFSLSSLAQLLSAKGDYFAAEALCRQALSLRRKLLGSDHPDVAESVNNLALLLQDKNDYAAAEPLYREALALCRNRLGDEHVLVANCLNNLAGLFHDKGDCIAAEPLYREALAMRRRLLGDEHLDVAQSYNNLALLLRAKGDLGAAEPLQRDALALYRKLLGDAHPRVANSLNNLALLLHDRGDYDGAEPLLREALALRRKLLGDKHPSVATSLTNLAGLLQAKGDDAAAEPLLREALAIRLEKLPPGHEHASATQARLGATLVKRGQYAEAEQFLLQAHEQLSALPYSPAELPRVVEWLTECYEHWHAAEPDQHHDQQAAEWHARIQAARAARAGP